MRAPGSRSTTPAQYHSPARNARLFEDQLSEIQSSLGWLFMVACCEPALRSFATGDASGRCWTLASRFVRTAATAVTGAALRKARERVVRKIRKFERSRLGREPGFSLSVFRRMSRWIDSGELPLEVLGTRPGPPSGAPGYFKVLLVSHSAWPHGAPLCLLRVAEELSKAPRHRVFCRVADKGASWQIPSPASHPRWKSSGSWRRGSDRHDVPRLIASAFHEFSSRGVAVCNTLAVSEFHAAFAEFQVDVLSWIHELPTFISLLGGDHSIEDDRPVRPGRSWCRRRPSVRHSPRDSGSIETASEQSTTARTAHRRSRPRSASARRPARAGAARRRQDRARLRDGRSEKRGRSLRQRGAQGLAR